MSEGLNYTPKEEAADTNETEQKIERLQKETQELKEINDSVANLLAILERKGEEEAREILQQ